MDSRVINPGPFSRPASERPDRSKPIDFVRVLKRRRALILLTVLFVTGITGLIILLTPPTYSATATLKVDDEDDVPARSDDVASIREQELREQARIATLMELLRSRALAQIVARDLALHDDPEFSADAEAEKPNRNAQAWRWLLDPFSPDPQPVRKQAQRSRNDAAKAPTPELLKPTIDRLQSNISVWQDGQSRLVNVTAESRTPEKAQRIANKLVAVYMKAQIDEKRTTNRRKVEALQARVTELREALLRQDSAVESFKRAYSIDKGMGLEAGSAQMGRVASELAAARAARAEAYARSGSGGGTSAGSALLTELRAQQATLERKSAELSTLYGRGHPDVRNVTAQLDQVRRDIGTEAARVNASLRSEAGAQGAREGQLMGDLGALRSRSFTQNMASVRLGDLEREAETTRSLYVALLSRLKELRRQDAGFKADASLASKALLPDEPSFPQPRKMMGASLAGSLVLALLMSVIAEVMDHRVRTSEHIEALVGLPTVGMVPELTSTQESDCPHLTMLSEPCSSFAETIRGVFIELTRLRRPGDRQVLLVTSALPDEGKTTVSISLAVAAAAAGQRVAVVLFDMRRPGMTFTPESGDAGPDLPAYLEARATLDDIIIADPAIPALAIIAVNDLPADPGTLIASPRVRTLFDELRQRFDMVIVDTPPVLPVSDARCLSAHCDEALLVVRWSRTPPAALRSAVDRFGGEFTAALINRVDYTKHAQLAYGDALEHYSRYAAYYVESGPKSRWSPRNWWRKSGKALVVRRRISRGGDAAS